MRRFCPKAGEPSPRAYLTSALGIVVVGFLLGMSAIAAPAVASGSEAPGEHSGAVSTSIAPLNPAPGDPPTSVLFPPSAAGWPGEVGDPRDVARYLAWHKAAAMERSERMRDVGADPTPNQLRYDVNYYDLRFDLNPTQRILTGDATIRARVVQGPLGEMDLDLKTNMTVSSVTIGGQAMAFTHATNILRVTLNRQYATGEVVAVNVRYSGNPAGDAFGWGSWSGQPMIWTLSEPFGGRTWWPSKDYSDDKADSVRIQVTAPTGLIAASNGTLLSQVDNGITSVGTWIERHPIATYLVSISVHPYHVYSDWYVPAQGDPMEIRFYNFQSSIPSVMPVQARVKDMLAAFAAVFGEYPFLDEKYGHAEFLWGGGMEHQTCTSLGYFGEGVVAHELGHQWYGDMITCSTFHDIWLNEGFATWSEAIWAEALYGTEGYRAEMALAQYFGPGTIHVPDLSDWGRIFDSNLSYNKASWIPHMLRGMAGDALFFQFLRRYYEEFQYTSISTAQFQALAESVLGRDLNAFFQQWIYGEYFPIYQYGWSVTPSGGGYDVHLDVEQVQSWQLFTMPIEIVVTTEAGPRSFQIENSAANQQYVLHVESAPTRVDLDPNNWILRMVLAPIPEPTFEYPILLVNGVDWGTYGNEIVSAYQNRAFSGDYDVHFWDCFPEPNGGYPAPLPSPRGHGSVPGEVLGQYSVVIWVGNNYNGDLASWFDSPIYSYLEAGGNVLLMTRMADLFVAEPYRNYLGVNWIGTSTVYDCISTYPDLTNIGRNGTQSNVTGFSMTVGAESSLLYKAVSGYNPNRGLGVIREPAGGGTYNPNGGRFVLLNGRPYRWVHADLKRNVEWLLQNKLGLPTPADAPEDLSDPRFAFGGAAPNPFGRATSLRFSLPSPAPVRLTVTDVAGRRVRVLADGPMPAGDHRIAWDGRDQEGRPVASGVYNLRLEAGERTLERKTLRLR